MEGVCTSCGTTAELNDEGKCPDCAGEMEGGDDMGGEMGGGMEGGDDMGGDEM